MYVLIIMCVFVGWVDLIVLILGCLIALDFCFESYFGFSCLQIFWLTFAFAGFIWFDILFCCFSWCCVCWFVLFVILLVNFIVWNRWFICFVYCVVCWFIVVLVGYLCSCCLWLTFYFLRRLLITRYLFVFDLLIWFLLDIICFVILLVGFLMIWFCWFMGSLVCGFVFTAVDVWHGFDGLVSCLCFAYFAGWFWLIGTKLP